MSAWHQVHCKKTLGLEKEAQAAHGSRVNVNKRLAPTPKTEDKRQQVDTIIRDYNFEPVHELASPAVEIHQLAPAEATADQLQAFALGCDARVRGAFKSTEPRSRLTTRSHSSQQLTRAHRRVFCAVQRVDSSLCRLRFRLHQKRPRRSQSAVNGRNY